MTDRQVVLLAGAAFCGALAPYRLPLAVVVAAVALAWTIRRPLWLLLAVAALVSTLSARSWAGLEPAASTPLEGQAQLVTDPRSYGPGVQVILRVDGRRYDAWAYGAGAGALRQALAGERVRVSGEVTAYRGSAQRQAAQHAAGRLSVSAATAVDRGPIVWRSANRVRSIIGGGAASLGVERQALFTGIVYGDDRAQSDETAQQFRLVGLTHLLAVSGQNVAFVLTLARPALRRLQLRGRWVGTLAVLVFFGFITRFEPSVLRATTMAGLASTSQLLGRPADSRRILALAVTGLLIIDPLLAYTVAFRLSVAASTGILVLSPHIEPRLPGPRWLRETAAVTLGAQAAVAPIIITTFGSMSPLTIPANLLAAPVAGPLMIWGLTGGVIAGLTGGWIAHTLHQPTRLLLWWLETIAATLASLA